MDKRMVEHALNYDKRKVMLKEMSNSPSNARMDPVLASAIKREAAKQVNSKSSRVSLRNVIDAMGA